MDDSYRSAINRDVPPAKPGEFRPLSLGKPSSINGGARRNCSSIPQ